MMANYLIGKTGIYAIVIEEKKHNRNPNPL